MEPVETLPQALSQSQPPRLQEAGVPTAVEDDVVEQVDPHYRPCSLQLFRGLDVRR